MSPPKQTAPPSKRRPAQCADQDVQEELKPPAHCCRTEVGNRSTPLNPLFRDLVLAEKKVELSWETEKPTFTGLICK
jgi:hypothetical protein